MNGTDLGGPGAHDEPAARTARRRLLELLGLAARAGGILTGIESVREAVRNEKVFWVLLAEDAALGQRRKLTPLLEARLVPFHSYFTRDELGAAIGRREVSAIGITDRGFARRAGELMRVLAGTAARPDRGAPLGSTHDGGL